MTTTPAGPSNPPDVHPPKVKQPSHWPLSVGIVLLSAWAVFGIIARLWRVTIATTPMGPLRATLSATNDLCNLVGSSRGSTGLGMSASTCPSVNGAYVFATVAFWAGIVLIAYYLVKSLIAWCQTGRQATS